VNERPQQAATGAGVPGVVLVSGGLDSAVVLAVARSRGYETIALSFDYGQRHRVELLAAGAVAQSLDASRHVVVPIDLRAVGGSALTDDAIAVPKDRPVPPANARHDESPATYVPARNLIFLSIATALAETVGASDLFVGVNAVDYSGYPDCREPFLRAFERAATAGTRAGAQQNRPFRVHAPLVALSKAGIIRLGVELGVDFGLTHSCYDPVSPDSIPASAERRRGAGRVGVLACGRCDTCVHRARGFAEAGVADPTRYAPSAASTPAARA
jgi:7-cyano-7-deazaguanine synthase